MTPVLYRALGGLAVGGFIAALWWLMFITRAMAHDAAPTAAMPKGWSYPLSCCSSYDCREVPAGAVKERPEGYVIDRTGEVVGYADARLKKSPDGEFHWCSEKGAADSRTICLFVPPRSY